MACLNTALARSQRHKQKQLEQTKSRALKLVHGAEQGLWREVFQEDYTGFGSIFLTLLERGLVSHWKSLGPIQGWRLYSIMLWLYRIDLTYGISYALTHTHFDSIGYYTPSVFVWTEQNHQLRHWSVCID